MKPKSQNEIKCQKVVFDDWLLSVAGRIEIDRNDSERTRIISGLERLNFYLGRPYGFWQNEEFVPISTVARMSPEEYRDVIHQVNYLTPFLNANQWQLAGSKPMYLCRPRRQDNQSMMAARVADALIKFTEQREWDEKKRQDFAMCALIWGSGVLYLDWDSKAGPEVDVLGTTVLVTPEGSAQLPTAIRAPSGMPVLTVVPPQEVKVDYGHDCVGNAIYIRRLRRIARGKVLQMYPNAKASGSLSIGTLTRSVEDGVTRYVDFGEYWIAPALYIDIELQRPFETDEGVIPAGTKLIDIFPNGIHFRCLPNEILEVLPDRAIDHWYFAHLKRLPNSLWGATYVEDLKNCQDEINRLATLAIATASYHAAPTLIVDRGSFEHSDFSGEPGTILHLRSGVLTENRTIRTFIERLEGTGVDSQVLYMIKFLVETMRQQAAAFTLGGEGGAPAETATAARIMQANANSNMSPTIDEFTNCRIKSIWQYLKMYQQKWLPEVFLQIIPDLTAEEVQAFQSVDLQMALEIIVDERSRMPQTEFDRQQDYIAFAQNFLINRQVFTPKELERAARVFGVEFAGLLDLDDRREAHRRIEILRSLAKMVTASEGNPSIVMAVQEEAQRVIAPKNHIDNHEAFMEEYKLYLRSAQGQRESEFVQMALETAIQLHAQAAAAMAQEAVAQQAVAESAGGIVQQAIGQLGGQEIAPEESRVPGLTPDELSDIESIGGMASL